MDLLRGISNEYIKQNIIVAVLRKANFHSFDICRSIKTNYEKKEDLGEKLSETLIFPKLSSC